MSSEATLRALIMVLKAPTDNLKKDLASNVALLEGFKSKAVTTLKSIAVGVSSAFAVNGLQASIKNQMRIIDEQSKLATKLDISTEALTAWQYGADLSGVSAEQLGVGLDQLSKRLGSVNVGVRDEMAILNKFGIDTKKLAGLGIEDAFTEIAEAVKGINDPTMKAQIAIAAFGRGGQSMLSFLDTGAKGLKQFKAEAASLGLSFSKIDGKNMEEANDAITRVSKSIEGLINQLLVSLAPSIDKAAKGLLGYIQGLGIGYAKANLMLANLQKNIMSIDPTASNEAIEANRRRIMTLKGEIMEAERAYNRLMNPVQVIQKRQNLAELEVLPDNSKIDEFIDKLKKDMANMNINPLVAQLRELNPDAVKGKEALGLIEAFEELQKMKKEMDDLKQQAIEVADSVKSPFEKWNEDIDKLRKLFDKGLITPDVFEKALNNSLKNIDPESNPLSKSFQLAGGLQYGSQEARSASLRSQGTALQKPLDKIQQISEEQLQEARISVVLLKSIADNAKAREEIVGI